MDLQHGLRFVEETSIRASTGKLKSEKGKSSKIQNCRIHSTDKSGVVCGRAVLLCHTHIKTPPTPDLEFGIQARRVVSVVSSEKGPHSTLFLFTQMYTGDILLGGNLRWTGIPSRGEKQYS